MPGRKKKAAKKRTASPEEQTLAQLCELVASYESPFEDVADLIENRAFAQCQNGGADGVVEQLRELAAFFEEMENKNEENSRDQADIYVLIGEILQYHDDFAESIEWFRKAIAVNDRYSVPFHSLAISYRRLGDSKSAARCLEQELLLAPGNYFSYLLLADLYEEQGETQKTEEILKTLLERDPNNLQALHKIITHYERTDANLDVEFLRRRIAAIRKPFTKMEMMIWVYHICAERRYSDALRFLTKREKDSPEITIIHLLKAYVYGEMREFTKKKAELTAFQQKNSARQRFMLNKLEEFEHIFGPKITARLRRRLAISRPSTT